VPPHVLELPVRWSHLDKAGTIYFPKYFEWFDLAAEEMFRAMGLDWPTLFVRENILGLPIVEATSWFFLPLFYNDTIRIVTTVGEIRTRAFRLDHEVHRGQELTAKGHVVRIWGLDIKGPQGKMAAAPLPSHIVQALQDYKA